jgi:hypothetical protein
MKRVVFIFSDVAATKFMQSMDVFESAKVVMAEPLKAKVPDEWGEAELKKVLEETDQSRYKLVGCIAGEFIWIDENVKRISDGNRCYSLEDYLKAVGPEPA